MASVGELQAILSAKIDGFKAEFLKASKSVDEFAKSSSKSMENAGKAITKYKTELLAISGAATAAMAGSVAAFMSVEDVLSGVQRATGATGDQMRGLAEVTKNVGASVPNAMRDVGIAIGELNTRLGLTGAELESVSTAFLDFARVNNQDIAQSVKTVSQLVRAFGLSASDSKLILDQMTLAGQKTGVNVQMLGDNILRSRVTLEAFGLNLTESIALFARLEERGVETTKVVSGFEQSIAKMNQKGIKPSRELFVEMLNAIKDAPSIMEASKIAVGLFGESGSKLAEEIRAGTLDLDEWIKMLASSEGTLKKTAENSKTTTEQLAQMRNEFTIAAADLGAEFIPTLRSILETGKQLTKWFREMPSYQKKMIADFTALTAALAIGILSFGKLLEVAGKIGMLKLPAWFFASDIAALGAAGSIKAFTIALGIAAVKIAAVTYAAVKLYEIMKAVYELEDAAKAGAAGKTQWAEYQSSVANTATAFTRLRTEAAKTGKGLASMSQNELAQVAKSAGVSNQQLLAIAANMRSQNFRDMARIPTEATEVLFKNINTLARSQKEGTTASNEHGVSLRGAGRSASGASSELAKLTQEAGKAEEAMKAAKEAVNAMSISLDKLKAIVADTSTRIRGDFTGMASDVDKTISDVTRALSEAAAARAEAEAKMADVTKSGNAALIAQATATSTAIGQEFSKLTEMVPEEIRARSKRSIDAVIDAERSRTTALAQERAAGAEELRAIEAELDGKNDEAKRIRLAASAERELAQFKTNADSVLAERKKELTNLETAEREALDKITALQDQRKAPGADTQLIDAQLKALRTLFDEIANMREAQAARIVTLERDTEAQIADIRARQALSTETLEASIRSAALQKSLRDRLDAAEAEKQAKINAAKEASLKVEQTEVERARLAQELAAIEAANAKTRLAIITDVNSQIGDSERGLTELRNSLQASIVDETQKTETARLQAIDASSNLVVATVKKKLAERSKAAETELSQLEKRRMEYERIARLRGARATTETAKQTVEDETQRGNIGFAEDKAAILSRQRATLESQLAVQTGAEKAETERELTRSRSEEESARSEATRMRVDAEVELEKRRADSVAQIFRDQFFVIENDAIAFNFKLSDLWDTSSGFWQNYATKQKQAFVEGANEALMQLFTVRDSSKSAAEASAAAWSDANADMTKTSGGAASSIGDIFGNLVSGLSSKFSGIGGIFGSIFGGGGGQPGIAGGSFGGAAGGLGGLLSGGIGSLLSAFGGPLGIAGMAASFLPALFGKKKQSAQAPTGGMVVQLGGETAGMLQQAAESMEKASKSPSVTSLGSAARASVVQSISVPVTITVNAEGLDEVAEKVRDGIPHAVRDAVNEIRRLENISERGLPRRSAA